MHQKCITPVNLKMSFPPLLSFKSGVRLFTAPIIQLCTKMHRKCITREIWKYRWIQIIPRLLNFRGFKPGVWFFVETEVIPVTRGFPAQDPSRHWPHETGGRGFPASTARAGTIYLRPRETACAVIPRVRQGQRIVALCWERRRPRTHGGIMCDTEWGRG